MYQITKADVLIGYTDNPEFCYLLPSGSPQIVRPKDKDQATGIIFQGVIYNLPGHDDFDGAETATVTERDAGSILNAMMAASDAIDAQTTYTAMMTDTLLPDDEEAEDEDDV